MDDSINTNLSQANFSTWSRSNISKEWFYESHLNSSSGKKCKQIYKRPKINSFQILIEEELITSALTLQVKLNRINVLVITLKFFNRIVDCLKNVGIRTIGQSLSILAELRKKFPIIPESSPRLGLQVQPVFGVLELRILTIMASDKSLFKRVQINHFQVMFF